MCCYIGLCVCVCCCLVYVNMVCLWSLCDSYVVMWYCVCCDRIVLISWLCVVCCWYVWNWFWIGWVWVLWWLLLYWCFVCMWFWLFCVVCWRNVIGVWYVCLVDCCGCCLGGCVDIVVFCLWVVWWIGRIWVWMWWLVGCCVLWSVVVCVWVFCVVWIWLGNWCCWNWLVFVWVVVVFSVWVLVCWGLGGVVYWDCCCWSSSCWFCRGCFVCWGVCSFVVVLVVSLMWFFWVYWLDSVCCRSVWVGWGRLGWYNGFWGVFVGMCGFYWLVWEWC